MWVVMLKHPLSEQLYVKLINVSELSCELCDEKYRLIYSNKTVTLLKTSINYLND